MASDGSRVKITSSDVFWWVVIGIGFLVIFSGCTAMIVRGT